MADPYVHGTNPVLLIDKIVRTKIYASTYYKSSCFALDAKTIIDKALSLKSIGGTYGASKKPTQFLCLLLKVLQINPEREIIQEYIQSDYKYLRCLGCIFLRLTGKPKDIYLTLEPLYNDYRKIKIRLPSGDIQKISIDEFVEDLIKKDIFLELVLPKIPKRHVLEENEGLPIRVSVLDGEIKFEENYCEDMQTNLQDGSEKPKKKIKLGEGGKNPQKEPVPESIEYWNNIRKNLGLPPLKET